MVEAKGSKKSALLFLISGFLMVGQVIISAIFFGDDLVPIVLAGCLGFLLFIGSAAAYVGGLTPVFSTQETDRIYSTEVRHTDTGQSIQCTPFFGYCLGSATLLMAIFFGVPLLEIYGGGGILFLLPSILGGIIGIIAGIVFVRDYKGPWFEKRF